MPFYFSSLEHQTPGDVKDLYRTFPYWGMRLHELWAEAENPTPLTSIGKMVERKHRLRWPTGVVGIKFAIKITITFGAVSNRFGALQVWLFYCSWMDNLGIPGCNSLLKS